MMRQKNILWGFDVKSQNHQFGEFVISIQNEEIQEDTQKSQNHKICGFVIL